MNLLIETCSSPSGPGVFEQGYAIEIGSLVRGGVDTTRTVINFVPDFFLKHDDGCDAAKAECEVRTAIVKAFDIRRCDCDEPLSPSSTRMPRLKPWPASLP
ncbi:unnamed protein product [Soboliphyme baturini]|uniref:ZP domain-containing protein n=1 Tax=Soboliphyme baturini TaxID=241478 RepID=A0A183IPS8_9BILA|nr:unnamed protein product [Soboliphyme baturini]